MGHAADAADARQFDRYFIARLQHLYPNQHGAMKQFNKARFNVLASLAAESAFAN